MNFSKLNIILFLTLITCSFSACHNNTKIKYQLKRPVQILNYHSGMCNQITMRTCCSPKNLDYLTKKIKKTILDQDVIPISPVCKTVITNMFCSYCDADIGEGYLNGICIDYCQNLYLSCRNDYFVLDERNLKIRACKQDDLICWKLQNLIQIKKINSYGYTVCDLFDMTISQKESRNCWNGQISSDMKGPGSKKVQYKKHKLKKSQRSFWEKLEKQTIYVIAISFLILVVLYKYFKPASKPKYYRLN